MQKTGVFSWWMSLLWSHKCQQNQNFQGHLWTLLSPSLCLLLSSLSRCFLSLPDCSGDGLGGVLAFSACDGAAIRTVCKPFEHCLNTPQPPFHPTHTGEPNNTSKLPPIAPPAPPSALQSRRADGRGNLLMAHVSIMHAQPPGWTSSSNYFFHVMEFSEAVNKSLTFIHQLWEWMRWGCIAHRVQSHPHCVTIERINDDPFT